METGPGAIPGGWTGSAVGLSRPTGVTIFPSRAAAETDAPVPSAMEESKRTDHGKRQKAEAEERKSPEHRLTLPPLTDEDKKKKKGEKNKPETSSSQEKYTNFAERKLELRKAELAKMLEEIEMTTDLTNLQKNAIEELKQCSACLVETNCRLVKGIQHTDDSTARQARSLLQQYEVFQREKVMVQTSNQNRLDAARAELQEMEKTMEKNLGKLQQELDKVTSKVHVLQDELSILRTYVDGQYPEEAVYIILLQDRIQSLKKQQQEEIERTEEMVKAALEELKEKAQADQKAVLQKVVEEMLLHQDGLKQMVINNRALRRNILRQKEIIRDLEKEIGELKRSVHTLRQSARDPREMIFADVVLRRPKCTPDTEVVLSIPAEGTPLR